jgi:hypothetical protein
MLASDIDSLGKNLKHIPNCNLEYRLFSHFRLLKIQQLVAENEVIGRFVFSSVYIAFFYFTSNAYRLGMIPSEAFL